MAEIRKLKCGLRLVLEKIDYVQSVTAGIWVKAGSADEDESCTGISHFIEHMMFKGTSHRSSRQIAIDTDALGAQTNAFTSKEYTCYYAKSISSNLEKVCDILLDMITDSKFDPVEMEREKRVVMEEMKMVEDTPEELVQDMIYDVLYKGNPLANSILGTPESLEKITRDDILDYIRREYVLDHIVVSVAGNFDEDRVCEIFEERLSGFAASKPEKELTNEIYVPSFKTRVKDIEQSHLILAVRTLEYSHDDVYALSLLNNILGGSMSSRLFQNIREEKGLAYSVYSTSALHDKTGFFNIIAGVAHEKVEETVAAVRYELEKLADGGVTDEELEISKEQIKSSLMFGLESTSSRMVSNGKRVLLRNKIITAEESIKRVDKVTQDDIRRMISLITDISAYSGSLVSRRDLDLALLMV